MAPQPHPESSALLLQDENLWYKDAVIYQLHVRTFCDSNGDGIGDFRGLTTKLDYLQELGINAFIRRMDCSKTSRIFSPRHTTGAFA